MRILQYEHKSARSVQGWIQGRPKCAPRGPYFEKLLQTGCIERQTECIRVIQKDVGRSVVVFGAEVKFLMLFCRFSGLTHFRTFLCNFFGFLCGDGFKLYHFIVIYLFISETMLIFKTFILVEKRADPSCIQGHVLKCGLVLPGLWACSKIWSGLGASSKMWSGLVLGHHLMSGLGACSKVWSGLVFGHHPKCGWPGLVWGHFYSQNIVLDLHYAAHLLVHGTQVSDIGPLGPLVNEGFGHYTLFCSVRNHFIHFTTYLKGKNIF